MGEAKHRRRTGMDKLIGLAKIERTRTGGKIENPHLWNIELVSLEVAIADRSKFDERRCRLWTASF